MKICLCFGGPGDERNISAGSIKPWITWLQAERTVALSVLFFDRSRRAWKLPAAYFHANTCEDFEGQLAAGEELRGSLLEEHLAAQDVVVPLIHGRFGEDGELQELLEGIGVPYTFSEPAALERTMDKARCYEALAEAGLATPAHLVFDRQEWEREGEALHRRALGLAGAIDPDGGPCLAVKPLRGGSSLGVSLVADDFATFEVAVRLALKQDSMVLVEELLEGVEFSVVVLETDHGPVPLAPTEVQKRAPLHDTRAKHLLGEGTRKYQLGEGARLHTPLRRDQAFTSIRRVVAAAWRATGLRDLARIDGFLADDGEVTVTDVNGISGMGLSSFAFLQTSMAGLSHAEVIAGLVNRAARRGGVEPLALGSSAANRGRIHVLFGGSASERQVSRQSGVFAGLCLLARGFDVRFVLMDGACRFTEIGLFYALHHDVEEIEALIRAPARRARISQLARLIGKELELPPGERTRNLYVGPTTTLEVAVREADFVFLGLHGGPGEDGTVQAALEALGKPYNGCGPEASRRCSDKVAAVKHLASAGLLGVGVPRQRPVTLVELLEWVQADAWRSKFVELQEELGSSSIVCKPARDGCSTGVKLLSDEQELGTFAWAIVTMTPFVPAEALGPGSRPLKLPEPPPDGWVFEQAFVEAAEPPLPRGDLNARNLREWFVAKRYIEITVAVLEGPSGELFPAVPSATIAGSRELSLEEKFQQGVGTNLELSAFLGSIRVRTIRSRVARMAEVLGVQGYARLDCFYDQRDDVVYLLEVNTLCALSEATVFHAQALATFGSPPPQTLEWIVEAGRKRSRRPAQPAGALLT